MVAGFIPERHNAYVGDPNFARYPQSVNWFAPSQEGGSRSSPCVFQNSLLQPQARGVSQSPAQWSVVRVLVVIHKEDDSVPCCLPLGKLLLEVEAKQLVWASQVLLLHDKVLLLLLVCCSRILLFIFVRVVCNYDPCAVSGIAAIEGPAPPS
jgi:hypothetical protein